MSEINTSRNKSGKKRSKKASTKVDMTAMVDLAFLLLTFFMLTTTFGKPQAMQVNMPDKTDNNEIAPIPSSKAFTIILAEDDKVFYFSGYNAKEAVETDFSSNGVRKVVMEKLESINDLIIVIKPSAKSRYKNLVDILDEMDITGAKRYAIVDISPEDLALIE